MSSLQLVRSIMFPLSIAGAVFFTVPPLLTAASTAANIFGVVIVVCAIGAVHKWYTTKE